jgi:hypothetical protein
MLQNQFAWTGMMYLLRDPGERGCRLQSGTVSDIYEPVSKELDTEEYVDRHISRDSLVRIVAGYELDYRGSIPSLEKKFVSIAPSPDRLWDTSGLLFNGSGGSFLR